MFQTSVLKVVCEYKNYRTLPSKLHHQILSIYTHTHTHTHTQAYTQCVCVCVYIYRGGNPGFLFPMLSTEAEGQQVTRKATGPWVHGPANRVCSVLNAHIHCIALRACT